MRSRDDDAAAWSQQPVELLHRPDHVSHMLDDVGCPDLPARAIAERKWKSVEVSEHIRARIRVPVKANGARVLVDPASDIECRKDGAARFTLRGKLSLVWQCRSACGHGSSVAGGPKVKVARVSAPLQ